MRQGRYDVYDVCKVCASNIEQQIENDPVLKASRDAYQKGVEAGYEKGHKKGYNEGYIDGDL
jgi:flagellar biosynthesis/type III secretory pathway protein FliH